MEPADHENKAAQLKPNMKESTTSRGKEDSVVAEECGGEYSGGVGKLSQKQKASSVQRKAARAKALYDKEKGAAKHQALARSSAVLSKLAASNPALAAKLDSSSKKRTPSATLATGTVSPSEVVLSLAESTQKPEMTESTSKEIPTDLGVDVADAGATSLTIVTVSTPPLPLNSSPTIQKMTIHSTRLEDDDGDETRATAAFPASAHTTQTPAVDAEAHATSSSSLLASALTSSLPSIAATPSSALGLHQEMIEENKLVAVPALLAPKSNTSVRNASTNGEVCDTYEIDMLAPGFSQCKCGHLKSAHSSPALGLHQETKEEEKLVAVPALRVPKNNTSVTHASVSGEVCDTYVFDMLADLIGQCKCGHLKRAHKQFQTNHTSEGHREGTLVAATSSTGPTLPVLGGRSVTTSTTSSLPPSVSLPYITDCSYGGGFLGSHAEMDAIERTGDIEEKKAEDLVSANERHVHRQHSSTDDLGGSSSELESHAPPSSEEARQRQQHGKEDAGTGQPSVEKSPDRHLRQENANAKKGCDEDGDGKNSKSLDVESPESISAEVKPSMPPLLPSPSSTLTLVESATSAAAPRGTAVIWAVETNQQQPPSFSQQQESQVFSESRYPTQNETTNAMHDTAGKVKVEDKEAEAEAEEAVVAAVSAPVTAGPAPAAMPVEGRGERGVALGSGSEHNERRLFEVAATTTSSTRSEPRSQAESQGARDVKEGNPASRSVPTSAVAVMLLACVMAGLLQLLRGRGEVKGWSFSDMEGRALTPSVWPGEHVYLSRGTPLYGCFPANPPSRQQDDTSQDSRAGAGAGAALSSSSTSFSTWFQTPQPASTAISCRSLLLTNQGEIELVDLGANKVLWRSRVEEKESLSSPLSSSPPLLGQSRNRRENSGDRNRGSKDDNAVLWRLTFHHRRRRDGVRNFLLASASRLLLLGGSPSVTLDAAATATTTTTKINATEALKWNRKWSAREYPLPLEPWPLAATATAHSSSAAAPAAAANIPASSDWTLRAEDAIDLKEAAALLSLLGRSEADARRAAGLYRRVERRLAQEQVGDHLELKNKHEVAGELACAHAMVRLALADSIVAEARIRTHSNTVPLRGTLDTPAFRHIWAALMPEALNHATAALAHFDKPLPLHLHTGHGEVYGLAAGRQSHGQGVKSMSLPGVAWKEHGDSVCVRHFASPPSSAHPLSGVRSNKDSIWLPPPPQVPTSLPHRSSSSSSSSGSASYVLWVLPIWFDAFLFDGSAKGIVNQALSGAGLTFLHTAKRLNAEYPEYEACIGHAYLGAFYTVAPWPLQNLNTAAEHMSHLNDASGKHCALVAGGNEGSGGVPITRRSRYYQGVVAFRRERWSQAVALFEDALALPLCPTHTERDFCAFMTEEAKTGAAEARKMLLASSL